MKIIWFSDTHVTAPGMPISAIKSPHVGYALEMTERKLVRSGEAPGYGVVLANRDGVVVHQEEPIPPSGAR